MLHTDRNKQQARDRAVEMLQLVGIRPKKRMKQYAFGCRAACARGDDRHGAGL